MSADQEQKDFTAKDARTTPLSQAQSRSGRLRNTKNQESAQSETFVILESSGADPSPASPRQTKFSCGNSGGLGTACREVEDQFGRRW